MDRDPGSQDSTFSNIVTDHLPITHTGLKSSAGWIDADGFDYNDDTADKYTDDNHENHDHGKDESCDEAAVGEETVPQGGEASGGSCKCF